MSAFSSDINTTSASSSYETLYNGKNFSGNPSQWATFETEFVDWAAQQHYTVRETVPAFHPQYDPANPGVLYDNTMKPASLLVMDPRACRMELDIPIPYGRAGMSAQQERDIKVQQEIAKSENARIVSRNASKARVLRTLEIAFLSAVPESTKSDLTVWRRSNREATFADLVAYCRDTFTRTNPLSARVDLLADTLAHMGTLPTVRAWVATRRKAYFDYNKRLFELCDPARMTPAIQQELFADTFISGLELSYRGMRGSGAAAAYSFCMPKSYQQEVGRFLSDQDTLMLPTFTERLTRFEVRMQQMEAMAMTATENSKAQQLIKAEAEKRIKAEIAKRDRTKLNATSMKGNEDRPLYKKGRGGNRKKEEATAGKCACGCSNAVDCTCSFKCEADAPNNSNNDPPESPNTSGWDAIKKAPKDAASSAGRGRGGVGRGRGGGRGGTGRGRGRGGAKVSQYGLRLAAISAPGETVAETKAKLAKAAVSKKQRQPISTRGTADSGAEVHASGVPFASLLTNLVNKQECGIMAEAAFGTDVEVAAVGDLSDTIKRMHVIPGMHSTLYSLSQLRNEGYWVILAPEEAGLPAAGYVIRHSDKKALIEIDRDLTMDPALPPPCEVAGVTLPEFYFATTGEDEDY
jgi:hypothetical protein